MNYWSIHKSYFFEINYKFKFEKNSENLMLLAESISLIALTFKSLVNCQYIKYKAKMFSLQEYRVRNDGLLRVHNNIL